jgi:hypothetical protein
MTKERAQSIAVSVDRYCESRVDSMVENGNGEGWDFGKEALDVTEVEFSIADFKSTTYFL